MRGHRAEPLQRPVVTPDQELVDERVGHHGVELLAVHHVPLDREVAQLVERLQVELPRLLALVAVHDRLDLDLRHVRPFPDLDWAGRYGAAGSGVGDIAC